MTLQSNPIAKWKEFWATIKGDDFFGHQDKSGYGQSLVETILFDVLAVPGGHYTSLYQYHFKHHHDQAMNMTDEQWEDFCEEYRLSLAEEFSFLANKYLDEYLQEINEGRF